MEADPINALNKQSGLEVFVSANSLNEHLRLGLVDCPAGKIILTHGGQPEAFCLLLREVETGELGSPDVLDFTARLANDPVARIEHSLGLAEAVVLLEDDGDDSTGLSGLPN